MEKRVLKIEETIVEMKADQYQQPNRCIYYSVTLLYDLLLDRHTLEAEFEQFKRKSTPRKTYYILFIGRMCFVEKITV